MKEILDFIITFSSILWEALPFVILGAIIAGILEEFLPQQWITRFLPKKVLPAVMIGGLLGLGADAVNVKGKSLEGLGALAGGQGVAAQAVCLIEGET